jgi:hypothetical protein
MSPLLRGILAGAGVSALFLVTLPIAVPGQTRTTQRPKTKKVAVTPGAHYEAGGLRRFFFGDGYRDLWTTPIEVPVLDLRTFAGGLRVLEKSGGNQTKGLKLEGRDGTQYVFRSVDKYGTQAGKKFKNTVIDEIAKDQISASHPAAAMVAARLLEAAKVLHVTPALYVMPDDSLLGEFREAFKGTLGMVEEFPSVPEEGPGFAGALEIVDSDTLLARLNRNPAERYDTTALLTARLMDMFLGDWDRHGGQWRWARTRLKPPSPWLPIPRDRDKAFISPDGAMIRLIRAAHPELAEFKGSYGSVRGLTWNSLEFDRRLLVGLERPVWDSVTSVLVRRLTDAVIENAAKAMPKEYGAASEALADTLKRRRDELPLISENFYLLLAKDPDIHGTDANDRARVTLVGDGLVQVRLESSGGEPFFERTFDANETREIRVYLHGGEDSAVVEGNVRSSIPLRVIGGNGNNHLIDRSTVDGSQGSAHLYDVGVVDDIRYGKPDTNFNRVPWIEERGKLVPQGRTRGSSLRPDIGLRTNRELGYIPQIGVTKYTYGFGRRPYASMLGLDVEYATDIGKFRVGFAADKRFEGTPLHFVTQARMSSLEVISYYGLGNNTAGRLQESGPLSTFFEVRQRQWLLYPAAGLTLGPKSELSLGPVLQYSETDSTPNRYIATVRPYGFGSFGQAGMRMALRYDTRNSTSDPRKGFLVDASTSFFPAMWDVEEPFTALRATGRAYVSLPIPVHPILVFRGGAAKVFGDYPFHEAAFIGGPGTLRSLDAQRYAGDASMYGSVELRVPFGNINFILPWNVGVFGVMDAGRVWVEGESPGGWHTSRGIGFWFGLLGPTTAIRICRRPGDSGPC